MLWGAKQVVEVGWVVDLSREKPRVHLLWKGILPRLTRWGQKKTPPCGGALKHGSKNC